MSQQETARLEALQQLNILDTPAEQRFDNITLLVREVFAVDIVLVSLVDECRQWFKSKQGIDVDETARDISFCTHAVEQNAFFEVNDTHLSTFRDNPLVTGSPFIRFYAGMPIRSEQGLALGTLCLIDQQPRKLTAKQVVLLEKFAQMIEHELTNTRLRHAEAERDAYIHMLREVSDNVPGMIFQFTLTAQGKAFFPFVNNAIEQFYGISVEQARDDVKHVMGIVHPEDAKRMRSKITYSGQHLAQLSEDYRVFKPDGRLAWLHVEATPERGQQGDTHWYGVVYDVSQQREYEEKLRVTAHFDALTQLPNRLLLNDRLERAIASCRRNASTMVVAYIDLDGFKAVNDAHGHHIGDRLLVEVAARFRRALRELDTLARLGGDEFVVVLGALDTEESAIPILQRLIDSASEVVMIDGRALTISASIGVSWYPQEEDVSADQLLRQADLAMYEAKVMGKNRYQFFNLAQDKEIRGSLEHVFGVRAALENQEMRLYYQPKVDLTTGEVTGVEALIRWHHPEKGVLAPGLWLNGIENNELIVEIGDWVLQEAIRQVIAWKSQDIHLPIAVNLAAKQLQRTDFLDKVTRLMTDTPLLSPGDLEFEIVETSALHDIKTSGEIIHRCQQMGISFSLDDFGTGYSSLAYLNKLPVNCLKIDRSFVSDMDCDQSDLAIVKGILGLAQTFQREVIAEGIETLEQGELLIRLGCRYGQGYVIAKPMPASEVVTWLRQWSLPAQWAASAQMMTP